MDKITETLKHLGEKWRSLDDGLRLNILVGFCSFAGGLMLGCSL